MGARKGFAELMTQTLETSKVRLLPIAAVLLITWLILGVITAVLVLVAVILMGLGAGLLSIFQTGNITNIQPDQLVMMLPVGILCSVPIFILALWSNAATVAICVNDKLSVGEALKAGFRYLLPMAWISFLYMGIVHMGFVLLILPAIVFSLWFLFSFYVMVDEEKRGMDALLTSFHYVKGDTWFVCWSLAVVTVLSLLVMMAASPIPFLPNILQLLISPFIMLFLLAIYRDLKERKGQADLAPMKISRTVWGATAICGLLLPVGLLGAMLLYSSEIQLFVDDNFTMVEQAIEGLEQTLPMDDPAHPAPSPLPVERQEPPGTAQQSPMGTTEETDNEQPSLSEHSGLWLDPAGDTGSRGSNFFLDIVEVRLDSLQDGLFDVSIVFTTPISESLHGRNGPGSLSRLITIFLDRDLDRETGRKPIGDGMRGGYDVAINVMLEKISEGSGNLQVSITEFTKKGTRSPGSLDINNYFYQLNKVTLHIPHSLLGVQAGQQVRACFQEINQQQGSGLSKDKLIKL